MADHLITRQGVYDGLKWLWVVALALFAIPVSQATPVQSSATRASLPKSEEMCARLDRLNDGTRDASPILNACIASLQPGGIIALKPGRYQLAAPVVLNQPVTIRTRGLTQSAAPCAILDRRCATLVVRPLPAAILRGEMPVTVQSPNVAIDHIIFAGGGNAGLCLDPERRPAAGGLRVSGDRFALTGSALTGFACYTALEYKGGAQGRIDRNLFANNGTHTEYLMWSDGLTVHGASGLSVQRNRFVNNTDVQLIFGGCTDCTVAQNVFRHTGRASAGSFAELMIHAWPKATTGRYDGTRVVGNDIDCGAQRRCGFGLMLGSTPWYDAPTSGGSVTGNRIANAVLPVNIDGLSGAMTVSANHVSGKPTGRVSSTCGSVDVSALVNIAPASRPFLIGNVTAAQTDMTRTFKGCLLNPNSAQLR